MTLPSLEQALASRFGLSGKLELLGFDTCLMACFEVARGVAPYAKVMVASEEMEPTRAWNYGPVLRELVRHPEMDGAALGTCLARQYQRCLLAEDACGATQSVLDLARLPALDLAVQELGSQCDAHLRKGARKAWIRLSAARARTEQFGQGEDSDEESSELYDLISFATRVGQQAPGTPAAAAADKVCRAAREAIIWSFHGEALPGAHGMSIFLPKRRKILDAKAPLSYQEAVGARAGRWLEFLRAYCDVTGEQRGRPDLEPLTSTRGGRLGRGGMVTFKSRCSAEELQDACFALVEKEEETLTVIGRMPVRADASGRLSMRWDGGWLVLTSGKDHVVCPIDSFSTEDRPDAFVARVPVELKRRKGKRWEEVTLQFYLRSRGGSRPQGRFMFATAETSSGPRQVTLRKGDILRPVYMEVAEDGKLEPVMSDEREEHLVVSKTNGLAVAYRMLPAGHYMVGFVITDYADNTSTEMTTVTIR